MHKYTKILIIFIFLLLPVYSMAATIVIEPSSGSKNVEDIFNVNIFVSPGSDEVLYTTKLKIKFNPKIAEILSFNLNDGWLPLTVSGYDKIDNINGTLIKTAGYTSGIRSYTKFASMKIKVKQSGSFLINVDPDGTKILDSNNKNKYTGSVGASFVINNKKSTKSISHTSVNSAVKSYNRYTPNKTVRTDKNQNQFQNIKKQPNSNTQQQKIIYLTNMLKNKDDMLSKYSDEINALRNEIQKYHQLEEKRNKSFLFFSDTYLNKKVLFLLIPIFLFVVTIFFIGKKMRKLSLKSKQNTLLKKQINSQTLTRSPNSTNSNNPKEYLKAYQDIQKHSSVPESGQNNALIELNKIIN